MLLDKNHRVFKLLKQNRFSADQIASMSQTTIQDVLSLAKKFNIGVDVIVAGQDSQLLMIENVLRERKHCVIYGSYGIGKTVAAQQVASKLNLQVKYINASDARTAARVMEEIQLGFRQEADIVYLLDEADNLVWSGYRTIVKLLDESRNSIIMTANDIENIPESIKKHEKLAKIPFGRPTLRQCLEFFHKKYKFLFLDPEKDGEKLITQLYWKNDGDMRKLVTCIASEIDDAKISKEKEIGVRQLASTMLMSPVKSKIFQEYNLLSEEFEWIYGWLFENATPENFRALMDVENWRHFTSEKYILGMMANLKPERMHKMDFPKPYAKAPKNEKKKETSVEKIKEKPVKQLPKISAADPFAF